MIQYVDEFKGISDRLAVLNIKLPNYEDMWSIVQVYSPTEQADKKTIEEFYENLNSTIERHTHKNLIVMGDFNGQTGESLPEERRVLGPFTYGTRRSKNGERLINMSFENNLYILNSKFKKKGSRKWTWVSPGGKYKNEIDFVLTNKPMCFTDLNVVNKFNFNTNHRMVRADLTLRHIKTQRPRRNFVGKLSIQNLKEAANKLTQKCADFEKETKNLDIQQKYDWFETSIKLAKSTCTNKEKKKSYLSIKTKNLLEARKQVISSRDTENRRKCISELSKDIKQSMRRDRKQNRRKKIEEQIIRTGGTKKAYKELSESKDWVTKVRNEKGIEQNRRSHIKDIATLYYKQLYENTQEEPGELIVLNDDEDESIPYILQREVEVALQSQSKDKAPGPDGIESEILLMAKNVLLPVITKLFNEIFAKEIIPIQWTQSNIVLLYKKGDKLNIGNYRPISLMSNLYKIFAKILLRRLERKLDDNQPDEQAGFRRGYSVLDHIHVMRQIIEKSHEYNQLYYMAYIDYSKAFDSLFHNKIWQALKEQGIESKYIRILREIYKKSTACIQLEKKGEPFSIQKGVRQGDPPKTFFCGP